MPLEVLGTAFPGGVHREVAPIFAALVEDLAQATGEAPRPGWCWGYAPRRIRGGSNWSNHAWGLAIDYNAPLHPLGRTGTWPDPTVVRRLAEAHGCRWGGDYMSRPDDMHFEFVGTLEDARARVSDMEADPMATLDADDVAAIAEAVAERLGFYDPDTGKVRSYDQDMTTVRVALRGLLDHEGLPVKHDVPDEFGV